MYYINESAFERLQNQNPNLVSRRLELVQDLGNGMYEFSWVDSPNEPNVHLHERMLSRN